MRNGAGFVGFTAGFKRRRGISRVEVPWPGIPLRRRRAGWFRGDHDRAGKVYRLNNR